MIFDQRSGRRWFAFFDLGCVTLSIILCEFLPQLGGWPLLIALLPWLIRWAFIQSSFRSTPLDLPLLFFVLTALVGAWVGQNRVEAWHKLWLLLNGVFLFYAIIRQPSSNRGYILGFFIFFEMSVIGYFLLTNDWRLNPVEIAPVNQLALWWMRVRPSLNLSPIGHNSVAGVIAFTAPFLLPVGYKAWLNRRAALFVLSLWSGLLSLIGFVMAASRGAILALGISLCLGIVWYQVDRNRAKTKQHRRSALWKWFIPILVLSITALFVYFSGGFSGLLSKTPELSMGGSRLDLAAGGVKLIGDYPFTGSGLDSYPGLYSTYILETPNFIVDHSHNIFIDIALEQSVVGFLAFCLVYFVAILTLFTYPQASVNFWTVCASFVSLASALIHGLSDDILFYGWGIPLLFLVPAIAIMVSKPDTQRWQHFLGTVSETISRFFQRKKWGVVFGCFLVMMPLLIANQSIIANWYADIGSIKMDRVELESYSTGAWDQGQNLPSLAPAKDLFLQALRFNPHNRTANFRLGLIAMQAREYPQAVAFLEEAYRADSNHRGIWKALGFSYVWSGRFDEALPFLSKISEASDELTVYPWWWRSQGQEELAVRAEMMETQLQTFDMNSQDPQVSP